MFGKDFLVDMLKAVEGVWEIIWSPGFSPNETEKGSRNNVS